MNSDTAAATSQAGSAARARPAEPPSLRPGQPLGAQHDRIEVGIIEHIGGNEATATSLLADGGADRAGTVAVDVRYHHDRAKPGQMFRDHSTGASAGTGNHRYTISNVHDT